MRTIFLLLFSCRIIDICVVCELIDIKDSMITAESEKSNRSAILDKAILRKDSDLLFERTPVSMDPLNLNPNSPFLPWHINRTSRNENRSSIPTDPKPPASSATTDFLSLSTARTSKGLQTSVNLPKNPSIPVHQSVNWNEVSTKSNRSDIRKLGKVEGYYETNAGSDDNFEKRGLPLIAMDVLRRREEKKRYEALNRQYPGYYDENSHEPDEDYASPDKYYSASINLEADDVDTNAQRYYSGEGGRYDSENYLGYPTYPFENGKKNRYYENNKASADYYSAVSAAESLQFRPPRPARLSNSRYSVDSGNDHGSAPTLIGIFFSIGSNLMQLFKIGLGSGLSIVIPIIAIKLFLIPLKILKIIKIVKILLKLFFVVPFILRVFAPSIYSAIGLHHHAGFANKMEGISSNPESRDSLDPGAEHNNSSWWNNAGLGGANSTGISLIPEILGTQKCPSKVACELGSYLASRSSIPEKLTKFLSNNDPGESKDFDHQRNDKEEVTRVFLRALTQRWTYDRCEVFSCGISL